MKYLHSRKRRFCFLVLLVVVALAWPFLSNTNLNTKEFFLYMVGLVAPASLLFCIRKHIVKLIGRFRKILFCNWIRGVAISFTAAWVLFQICFAIESIIHEKNVGQLIHLYVALIPAIGAYGFSIKKRIAPILAIVSVFLSGWNALAGVILSLLISVAALPNKYPLTLEELLTSREVSGDEETDCLFFFVHTCKKRKIIPALENYVARRAVGSKFLGYHYLIHLSQQLESDDIFHRRVLDAEHVLGIPEIDILFPMPRFRNPEEE